MLRRYKIIWNIILIIGEKGITIKLLDHNVYTNEKQQDKQVFVVIHLSWQVTSYVIRTPFITPAGEAKMILSKKRKSSKSKSDYKVSTEKIDQAQEW